MRKTLFRTTMSLLLAGTLLMNSGFSVLAASTTTSPDETAQEVILPDDTTTETEEFIPIEQVQAQDSLAGSNIDLSQWESRAMGQSTDLDFQSTIHTDKIGINQSDIVRDIQVKDAGGTIATKDAIVIESRGGKIANGHDGFTFFYTKLPVDENFVLETKVYLNQLGPWESYSAGGAKSTPSKQEAVGLMVRDAVSDARQEPMLEGFEELPACSNMVSTMVMANAKALNTAIDIVNYARNGVYSRSGNGQIQYGSTKISTLQERGGTGDVTDDITPQDNIYNEEDFFTLKLEKTDTEFITTYISSTGATFKKTADDPGRVAVIDDEYMYVGLYAARNAKVTFADINLTTTQGTLPSATFTPTPYALAIDNYSNEYAPAGSYSITFRTNYSGTADVYDDNVKIASAVSVTAGEDIVIPHSISKATTAIKISFTDVNGRTKSSTVNVKLIDGKYTNKDLYIAPDGISTAEGTLDSPLNLVTGLNYISDGYTIYALGGTYGALDILTTMSGQAGNVKTLKPYKENEAIIFSGQSYLRASHWVLDQVKITGSTSAGMRVHGSYNLITNSEFYNNLDTGFQLGLGSGTSRELWPKNNTVSYCYSHHNVDESGINADGFASKLGIGPDNLFEWCESAYNADDGWDIFNKVGDIPNDPIRIRNCVAYGNGNNGYKLGGEGYPVNNVVEHCLAFDNGLDGFTCNFNTGVLTVTNNTSFDNNRYNYIFRYNPHRNPAVAGAFVNNISFRTATQNEYSDYIYSTDRKNNYFFVNGTGSGITAADFVKLSMPTKMTRNADLTFNYEGFMQPTASSVLNNGFNSTFIGAIMPVKGSTGGSGGSGGSGSSVTPEEVKVSKIALSKKTLSFDTIGTSKTITATVTPSNAVDNTVVWSTSNKKVATVSKGKIKAIGNGTATITATAGGKSATCKITVSQKSKSVKLKLNGKYVGKTLNVQTGKSYQFAAVVLPSNTAAKNAKIVWSVSNKKIATVSKTGKVTIKGTGKVTLKAMTADKKSVTITLIASKKSVKVKMTSK